MAVTTNQHLVDLKINLSYLSDLAKPMFVAMNIKIEENFLFISRRQIPLYPWQDKSLKSPMAIMST